MVAFLISGLLLGLGSSFHCAGMCGPLVLTMPFYTADGSLRIQSVVEYHFGKAMMYAILGGFFGVFGMGIKLAGFQQWFSIVFGVAIILFVLGPLWFVRIRKFKEFIVSIWIKFIFNISLVGGNKTYFLLGFSNGIIPCGIVYVALAASVLAYSASLGALFMFLFGIGTIPVLSLIISGRHLIKSKLNFSFTKISQWMTLGLAILFILRGLNLDIPFISPKIAENHKLECCKRK
ncbi:MAG: sulfite exporter TauE/SafE family protein [Saprospiraceae bacterium]|nr:sulfite exporter TauE/SafE family protein [Saprospiraceae bacterium]